MSTWPNFFIVGAPKAGTTSLYEYLKENSEIFMSSIKEPHYFSKIDIPKNHHTNPIRDEKKYLELFKNVKNEKIIGESSSTYLADPKAPALIHEVSPQAKILISLRDPIERTFSQYLMYIRDGKWANSFHDQLTIELNQKISNNQLNLGLHYGLYSEAVQRYFEIFGKQRVKIIIFEEFISSIKNSIDEIFDFLNVESIKKLDEKIHNPYKAPRSKLSRNLVSNRIVENLSKKIMSKSSRSMIRNKILLKKEQKPIMDNTDKKTLKEFYEYDVKKLKTIIDQEIPWSNFS